MLKKIVAYLLKISVYILLFRKKPEIIGITGSVGKTTTKNLIKELLSDDFDVQASDEGYNTEIGAPLMLFNIKAPKRTKSAASWLKIIGKCFKYALSVKEYPEKVIVEMGEGYPGDIKYLARLFNPQKGVILAVKSAHLKTFQTIENIRKEKEQLALSVVSGGKVFLNCDDSLVKDMNTQKNTKVVYFGKNINCNLRAENIKSEISGIEFDLVEGKNKTRIKTLLFGEHMIYPILASIAVARSDHISIDKIKNKFLKIKPTIGRMNVIEGINNSLIIDDSYNASPEAAISALNFLGKQKGRHISILGSMNELGEYEKRSHEEVGKKAAEVSNIIITVGEVANKYLVESAISSGFNKKNIKSFLDSKEAGLYARRLIKKGDIILCKGSQNKIRIERAVKEIMLDKKNAKKILVRQSDFWNSLE